MSILTLPFNEQAGQAQNISHVMANDQALRDMINGNLDTDNLVSLVVEALVPTGSVVATATAAAATGWLLCDGAAISRTTYATLFAAIGTAYGVGDGSTTFNIPDLRGRAAYGKGTNAEVNALNANDGLGVGSRKVKHQHGLGTLATAAVGNHSHTGFTGYDADHFHAFTPKSLIPVSDSGFALFSAGAGGVPVIATNGPITQGNVTTTTSTGPQRHTISADGSHSHSVTGAVGDTSGPTDSGGYVVLNYQIKV